MKKYPEVIKYKNKMFLVVKTNPVVQGLKYNVQVYTNGDYAGVGRFCRTRKEVDDFIAKYKKRVKN